MKWTSVILGAAAFIAANGVEVAAWSTWFGPDHEPWFLNSGRAVAFTAGCLLVAGMGAGAARRSALREAMLDGVSVTVGAVLAMMGVLFATGPGAIFPIVLIFGSVIAAAASVPGALVGSILRSAFSSLRRR